MLMRGVTPIPEGVLDTVLGPEAAILDVGCGSGIWCSEIGQNYPLAKVIGLDVAKCDPKDPPNNCSFIQGNLLDGLEQCYGQFDLVHCRAVIIHVEPAKQNWAVRELVKCLRPGGLVVLSDFDELFLDEHRTRLPAAQDNDASEKRVSWMARLRCELFRQEDPVDSILRFKIRDALQDDPEIDQTTLGTALYEVPVGWEGYNDENGALLGKMASLDFMDGLERISEDVIEVWGRNVTPELTGTGTRFIHRWHSTWARKTGST
ncbi:S-adenosyl-L-methionine-dependent methyltransferase [Sistotremastrum niveocremeum HHB9708]|uniref:S-adenosyl-L-methionine-dependent methyltransferase n=1 Tax=Sistotremastrum niveocremeum HHB9708 TaxID=1314777 RepID=A0A164Y6X3_9AGAM|nr:S-adenosyl-L-methionine-dependent methyltransferase [Sistotremastrum niveocremeum HHB9708]